MLEFWETIRCHLGFHKGRWSKELQKVSYKVFQSRTCELCGQVQFKRLKDNI